MRPMISVECYSVSVKSLSLRERIRVRGDQIYPIPCDTLQLAAGRVVEGRSPCKLRREAKKRKGVIYGRRHSGIEDFSTVDRCSGIE